MNQKLKKIVASLLVVGVGIVWIPQIYAAVTKVPPPTRAEIPALGLDAATTASVDAAEGPTTPVQEPLNGGTDSSDLAHSLESSLAKAKRLLPEKPSLDLDKLASAWTTPIPPTAAPSVTTREPETVLSLQPTPSTTRDIPLVVDFVPVRDPIDDFLATHPLEGTLIGPSRRLACLGPLLLAVGDEPVRGLKVAAIESSHVSFTRAGQSVRVDLKPFEARAPITQSSPASSGANAGEAAPTGAPATQVSGVPSPLSQLDKLLPLLEQAAANSAGVNTPVGRASANASNTNTIKSTDKSGSIQNGNGS